MKTSPPCLPSPPPLSHQCTSPGPRIGSTSTPDPTTGRPTNVSGCTSSHKTWPYSPPREGGSSLPTLACSTLICTHQYGPGNMSLFQSTFQKMFTDRLLSMSPPRPPKVQGKWEECKSTGSGQMNHLTELSFSHRNSLHHHLLLLLFLHHHHRVMWRTSNYQ